MASGHENGLFHTIRLQPEFSPTLPRGPWECPSDCVVYNESDREMHGIIWGYNIQILLTELYTFSYSFSWENLLKEQTNYFPLVIISFSLSESFPVMLVILGT